MLLRLLSPFFALLSVLLPLGHVVNSTHTENYLTQELKGNFNSFSTIPETLLLITPQAIWTVNQTDFSLELYMSLEPDPDLEIYNVAPNLVSNSVFLLQRPSEHMPSPLDEITLTQVNTISERREIVLHRVGVLNFQLSSDGKKASVTHFYNDEGFNGAPITFCILDIDTGKCSEIDMLIEQMLWINDSDIIILSPDTSTVYIMSTLTHESRVLYESFYVSAFAFIPSTNELLIAEQRFADNYKIEFTSIDLSNSLVSRLPYRTVDDLCAVVDYLSVSSSKLYLMYSCRSETVLVDYETGQLLSRFRNLASPQWATDGRSIFAIDISGVQPELVKIDINTGNIEQSVSIPWQSFLVMIP